MRNSYSYLWQNKGSILVVGLWILISLTILVVIIAWRVSNELIFVRNQRDRLKALYLAKAGIIKSISLLEEDLSDNETKDYDSIFECGLNLKGKEPEEIFLKEYENGRLSFRIGYNNLKGDFIYGMSDEESRIYINRTDDIGKEQLKELFLMKDIEDAQNLADTIIAWIDSNEESDRTFKNKPLSCPEELLVILDYFYQQKKGYSIEESKEKSEIVFNKIKDLITVYGDGSININTASIEVLKIFTRATAFSISQEDSIDTLLSKIINLKENETFKERENFNQELRPKLTTEELNIFNKMAPQLKVKSDYFRIESVGIVKEKILKKIITVIDRRNLPFKKLYWYEG